MRTATGQRRHPFAWCIGLAVVVVSLTGDPSRDTVAMTRIDPATVDIVNKKAGAVVSRMRIAVAADGRSRTNTVTDSSGQKTTAVLFFERQ